MADRRDVHFTVPAPVPVETVWGALLDFSPGRPDRWPSLDPAAYRVEQVSRTSALIREGQRSPRLWALEAYDWSAPGEITWTVRESNFCRPGSWMSARAEPDGAGGSMVHFRWNRTGTGVKGRLIVALLRATRCRPLATSLADAFARMGAVQDTGRQMSGDG
jgi:hypothetical protein